MAKITYKNKSKPVDRLNPEVYEMFSYLDANEVKTVVNGLDDAVNAVSSGVTNAEIGVAPPAGINTVNFSTAGTYPLYSGLVITNTELQNNIVQGRKNSAGTWVKFLIPVGTLVDRSVTTEKIALGGVQPENTSFMSQSAQLYDKATMSTYGSLVNNSNGSIAAAAGWTYITVPVDRSKSTSMVVKSGSSNLAVSDRPFNFYDAGGARLSITQNNPAAIPVNAVTMKMNISNAADNAEAAKNSVMIAYGTVIPTVYEAYAIGYRLRPEFLPVVITDTSTVAGKKLRWVGDSITAATAYPGLRGYVSLITEELGVISTNKGDQGATIAQTTGASCMSGTLLTYQFDPDTALCTIFGGVNDFLHSVPIGTNTDTDNTTLKGSLIIALDWLTVNHPNCKRLVFTPIERGTNEANTLGLKLIDYVNAIVEICALKSTQCEQLYYTSILSMPTAYKNLVDGLHPNNGGYLALYPTIQRSVLKALAAA